MTKDRPSQVDARSGCLLLDDFALCAIAGQTEIIKQIQTQAQALYRPDRMVILGVETPVGLKDGYPVLLRKTNRYGDLECDHWSDKLLNAFAVSNEIELLSRLEQDRIMGQWVWQRVSILCREPRLDVHLDLEPVLNALYPDVKLFLIFHTADHWIFSSVVDASHLVTG